METFTELAGRLAPQLEVFKPKKEISTYNKMKMWKSLNELIMRETTNSSFMYMIETTEVNFIVKFVDSNHHLQGGEIIVPFLDTFEWPETWDTIRRMSCSELKELNDRRKEYGIPHKQFCQHYGRQTPEFLTMIGKRGKGMLCREDFCTIIKEQENIIHLLILMDEYSIPHIGSILSDIYRIDRGRARDIVRAYVNGRFNITKHMAILKEDYDKFVQYCRILKQILLDAYEVSDCGILLRRCNSNVPSFIKQSIARVMGLNNPYIYKIRQGEKHFAYDKCCADIYKKTLESLERAIGSLTNNNQNIKEVQNG